jgi:hypothetical protein
MARSSTRVGLIAGTAVVAVALVLMLVDTLAGLIAGGAAGGYVAAVLTAALFRGLLPALLVAVAAVVVFTVRPLPAPTPAPASAPTYVPASPTTAGGAAPSADPGDRIRPVLVRSVAAVLLGAAATVVVGLLAAVPILVGALFAPDPLGLQGGGSTASALGAVQQLVGTAVAAVQGGIRTLLIDGPVLALAALLAVLAPGLRAHAGGSEAAGAARRSAPPV